MAVAGGLGASAAVAPAPDPAGGVDPGPDPETNSEDPPTTAGAVDPAAVPSVRVSNWTLLRTPRARGLLAGLAAVGIVVILLLAAVVSPTPAAPHPAPARAVTANARVAFCAALAAPRPQASDAPPINADGDPATDVAGMLQASTAATAAARQYSSAGVHAPSPALRATVGRLAGDEQAMATGSALAAAAVTALPPPVTGAQAYAAITTTEQPYAAQAHAFPEDLQSSAAALAAACPLAR